jgi:hypothetical protein
MCPPHGGSFFLRDGVPLNGRPLFSDFESRRNRWMNVSDHDRFASDWLRLRTTARPV